MKRDNPILLSYRNHVRRHLPSPVRRELSRLLSFWQVLEGAYGYLRVRPAITRLLGPQFRRDPHKIVISITYECNLRCFNCDVSSAQAPADTQMTVEQIQRFVDESVAVNYRWDHLIISGGEPTLHKDFFRILNILRAYRDCHSPHTRIHVTTDGTGKQVKQAVAQIPNDVVVIDSNKGGKRQVELYHTGFNVAAEDVPTYRKADFRNACDVTQGCGSGLGPSGYYHCPVAAGMDRIFGWNIGRKSLPPENDSMEDLAERFCGKCGHFLRQMKYKKALDKPLMSATWERAYAAYRDRTKEELVVLQPASNSRRPEVEELPLTMKTE